MEFACSYLERYHANHGVIGLQRDRIKNALRTGNVPEALKGHTYKKELENILDINK